MKTIVLTGLRNEVDMQTGEATVFGLVFNHGALHIPITSEIMESVVAYAFGEDRSSEEPANEPTEDDNEMQDVPASDDDIPQM
jgi:hypothetical protein